MTVRDAPAPTGGDDQALVQGVIDNAVSGDEIVFPSGSFYKHSGKIILRNKVLYIRGALGERFTWQATNPDLASFHIWNGTDGSHIKGLTAEVLGATVRLNNGFQHAGIIIDYANGIWTEDVISKGAAGLGWYLFNANFGKHERAQTLKSGADGFHLTYGSHDNEIIDLFQNGIGDDFLANIGYLADGEAGRPYNNKWIRPIGRDGHARGAAFAGARDSVVIDPDFTDTRAASIMFACERGDFNTSITERCSVTGGKARRSQIPKDALGEANNNAPVHAGPILYAAGVAGGLVDCTIDGTSVGDFTPATSAVVQVSGFAPTGTSGIANLKMYAGTPAQLWIGTPVGSSATWSDLRSQTMAATATQPVGAAPTTPTNPSTGTRATVPGRIAYFTAEDFAGLADNTRVTSWSDKVGGRILTAPSASAPKKVTDANGKPGLVFDNDVRRSLEQASGAPVVNAPFTVVFIARVPAFGGSDNRSVMWHSSSSGSAGEVGMFTGRWGAYGGGYTEVGSPLPVAGQMVIVDTMFANASSSIFLNGTSISTANLGGNPMNGGRMVIGNHGDQRREWGNAPIFEVHVYDHTLTAAERAIVHSDAQDAGYGITVSDYAALPSTVVDRWDGAQLVRQVADRWDGSALVRQVAS